MAALMGFCGFDLLQRIFHHPMDSRFSTDTIMNELLIILLRIAGAGLFALALLHFPISKSLAWKSEAARMSPVNESIFHVHAIFICVVLLMMGAPCLFEPAIFLEQSRAARWLTISFSIFWGLRFYFQWFVYKREFWQGKKRETVIHWICNFAWLALTILFGYCAYLQSIEI
jgi:hypothetical protein